MKRYQVLRFTTLEMENHEKFARLVFLVAHVFQHQRNLSEDRRGYVPSTIDLNPTAQCGCTVAKTTTLGRRVAQSGISCRFEHPALSIQSN